MTFQKETTLSSQTDSIEQGCQDAVVSLLGNATNIPRGLLFGAIPKLEMKVEIFQKICQRCTSFR